MTEEQVKGIEEFFYLHPALLKLTEDWRRMRKALEFYATKDNYKPYLIQDSSGQPDQGSPKIYLDEGQTARAALAGLEREK